MAFVGNSSPRTKSAWTINPTVKTSTIIAILHKILDFISSPSFVMFPGYHHPERYGSSEIFNSDKTHVEQEKPAD
jgi:hypothetical protein